MAGAGVTLGQVALEYFAAIDRISTYRDYSDYDHLDLYRMLEVDDGTEDWQLLHQSDYGESTVSYRYTIRNQTETDMCWSASVRFARRFWTPRESRSGHCLVLGAWPGPAVNLRKAVSSRSRPRWQTGSPTSRCSDRRR